MQIFITSFSYRYGSPKGADIVFDVRFLANPFYEPDLTGLCGMDAPVAGYFEADADFADFFARFSQLVVSLLPRYAKTGKERLAIAIGCTGGRHRSVYVVKKLAGFIENLGYKVTVSHRDLEAS